MKKVTIPTCANPFVVIVNGMKYTYPAGETVEVPDDVAAVIEQHHDAHNNPKPEPVVPPFTPATGESGGGGLPVVELTTVTFAGQFVPLNDEESAALSAAYDSGMPVVIKVQMDIGGELLPITAAFTRTEISGARSFMTTFGSMMYQVVDMDGWKAGADGE